MLALISGAALAVGASAGFWYFLPRKGQMHPFVEKFDGGSMLTLAIMTVFTTGLVLIFAGFLG